jgi:hypothetical protein
MPMKKHKPEQIVTLCGSLMWKSRMLRPHPKDCREAEITVQTNYRCLENRGQRIYHSLSGQRFTLCAIFAHYHTVSRRI